MAIKIYKVTYTMDGERYSVYLNAKSPEEAKREIQSRTSLAVIESVSSKGGALIGTSGG